MNIKKLICLFLALTLMTVCFTACGGNKEQEQEQQQEKEQEQQQEQGKEQQQEQGKEQQQPEVIEVRPPSGQQGLTVDEEPLEIEIPEDSELVGDDLS